MRIVFMGTPDFAKKSLERLYCDKHDIAGVFTQPDKPRNRGMKLSYSPVKELALEHGTPVYQPVSLRDFDVAGIVRELKCELITVVAYGKLLPPEILRIPPYGCINIHGSLLPKYRGAAPIQWAVINGERETGVTSQYMGETLDSGDILQIKKTQIGENETAGELFERLGILGAELLSETVDSISSGNAARKPQNNDEATFAPMIGKDLSPVDWTETAHVIKCKVRGLNPRPAATASLGGTVYKIFSVDITDAVTGKVPGEIVSAGDHGIEVACANGTVIIKELQTPGGKRMSAADYLKGHSM